MRFSASFSSRGRKKTEWREESVIKWAVEAASEYVIDCDCSRSEWWFIHMTPVMLTVCVCVWACTHVCQFSWTSFPPHSTHPDAYYYHSALKPALSNPSSYTLNLNLHLLHKEDQDFTVLCWAWCWKWDALLYNLRYTITWKENERFHKLCFTSCMCWKPRKQDLWNTVRVPTDPFSADCRWDTLKMFIFIHLLCVCELIMWVSGHQRVSVLSWWGFWKQGKLLSPP